ncbi:MAG: RluA family pseudouridine synthase [Lachnospiraceae bacterium]|nr:RluA family pseudouridine synthase [Lachnospiraceae bacterium]
MEKEVLEFTVTDEYEGIRLDSYLAEVMTFSRAYVQKLIKNSNIKYNGNFNVKAKVPVHLDDRITVYVPEPEKPEILPENLDLDILYEDEALLVVNKPKGMVVHPAAGHMSHTLVNGLLYHCGDKLSGINGVLRPGIVHRIDKDTTGALVVCKTNQAHQSLAEQLSDHSITRKYEAVVYHNFSEEEGRIDCSIGRHPVDRKKMAALPDGNGRRAVTHYRVLSHLNRQFNHIECRLETGRTHQIRVHMSYIQHPLLGDTVYGPKPPKQFFSLQGQTLHARIIGFQHPVKNQYIEVEAPLPQYFVDVLKNLEK